jgi:hypothetical protein
MVKSTPLQTVDRFRHADAFRSAMALLSGAGGSQAPSSVRAELTVRPP